MADKTFRNGPAALTTTLTTNIYNGGNNGAYAGIADIITHIHIANKTGSAATFSLWLGATGANAAGTEIAIGESVAANDVYDLYFPQGLRMINTDFLVGGSNTATALSITVMGKQLVI